MKKIESKTYSFRVMSIGELEENCILVKNNVSNEGIIVDPGGNSSKIIKEINSFGLIPKAILNTHAHYDHIGAVEDLKQKFKIPFYIHKDEEEYCLDPQKNFSALMGIEVSIKPDFFLKEGDLSVGDIDLSVFHTPGHTKGGVCFLIENILLSGDTLFAGSVGRADLYGGDAKVLINSIKTKLLNINKDTIVVPGHGGMTTIGSEKKYNPFL